ncbi:MAG: FAD-dependent oxidoreductase [Brumimicrobium sp.]
MQKELDTEILIIGGGSAGIAASVAASPSRRVLLIDAHDYLGGNATISEVGTICGLYHYSKNEKTKYIVNGFAKTFADRLSSESNSKPLKNRYGMHYLPYDKEAFKEIAHDFIKENNVDLSLNTRVIDVQVEDNQVSAIIAKRGGEILKINCKSVIDCSGISIVSSLAKFPLLPSDYYQSAALVFTVSNIQVNNEFAINILFAKHLKNTILTKELSETIHSLHVVPGSFKDGAANFKMGIPIKVTLKDENKAELLEMGKKLVHEFMDVLLKNISAFENAELKSIADNVGIRVERRPLGKYVLTESDVTNCKKFLNPIAKSAWPIEEWKDNMNVSLTYLKEHDWYEIPQEALISNATTNLFFGGKNISATDRAIGSARVIGVCLQTGYAAGKLAHAFTSDSAK